MGSYPSHLQLITLLVSSSFCSVAIISYIAVLLVNGWYRVFIHTYVATKTLQKGTEHNNMEMIKFVCLIKLYVKSQGEINVFG